MDQVSLYFDEVKQSLLLRLLREAICKGLQLKICSHCCECECRLDGIDYSGKIISLQDADVIVTDQNVLVLTLQVQHYADVYSVLVLHRLKHNHFCVELPINDVFAEPDFIYKLLMSISTINIELGIYCRLGLQGSIEADGAYVISRRLCLSVEQAIDFYVDWRNSERRGEIQE